MPRHSWKLICACASLAASSLARAQVAHLPTQSGQAAYGAIAEIVRMLEADPTTDWSKVDVEGLRQHLLDMDDVMMRSTVATRSVDGGVELDVTGSGRTVPAVRRMLTMHAMMLNGSADYRASAREIPAGLQMKVTARDPGDAQAVARIRALGFAGLLAEGDHHARHHLAIARGEAHTHSN
jgi:hypothetical protein